MKECMLTTIDNPFNPFKQFNEWLAYDRSAKHFTCEYLDRIANTSTELSDLDYQLEVEDAIDRILKFDPDPKWRKVYEDDFESVKKDENVVEKANDPPKDGENG